jgi:diphthine synthase
MTANQGLETLFKLENRRHQNIIVSDTMAVGIARAGSENPVVKADFAPQLIRFDFGQPPHSLILPGRLHFMEAEALVALAKAPETIKEIVT